MFMNFKFKFRVDLPESKSVQKAQNLNDLCDDDVVPYAYY